ncbi:MAG: serine protease, partial [Pirellulales bacterium]|nr:serine protease [Pirellulales bacterium]
MKNTVLIVCLFVLLLPSVPTLAKERPSVKPKAAPAKADAAKSLPKLDPRDVYRRLLKSTAWIIRHEADDRYFEGTGWLLDKKKRLLVTNEHVVKNVDDVEVYFPVKKDSEVVIEREYYTDEVKPIHGRVIDRSIEVDLALVQLDSVPSDIIPLEMAADSPVPGEKVFTLGSQPMGSEGMWIFATGDVRQVYRRSHARGHVARMVETQVPSNCGNSGGPVVNDRALVVAVVEGAATDADLVSLFVDIREIKKYIKEALPLVEPKTADVFNTRATRRHDQGRYDLAIEDYTAVLKLDPDRPLTLANRGWAFYTKEDYDSALADFDDALRRDPELGSAYEGRGTTYREQGEYEKAVADLTQAIRRDPTDPGLYQRRATAYQRDGQLEKALADRTRAIQRDDDNFDYFFQRGQTLRKLKRYEKALKDFDRAASLRPGSAAVCYEIGYVYQDQKQYPQAVFFYSLAINRDKSVASFYNNRGLCRLEMKEYLDAAQDFLNAIDLKPNHADYHRR